jgi:hypothetical protein
VDEAAPPLQRGRRGAAVLRLPDISYCHHFSASLRASDNGNGITSAGAVSVSVSRPAGCPAGSSFSPRAGAGSGRGHCGAAVAAARPATHRDRGEHGPFAASPCLPGPRLPGPGSGPFRPGRASRRPRRRSRPRWRGRGRGRPAACGRGSRPARRTAPGRCADASRLRSASRRGDGCGSRPGRCRRGHTGPPTGRFWPRCPNAGAGRERHDNRGAATEVPRNSGQPPRGSTAFPRDEVT